MAQKFTSLEEAADSAQHLQGSSDSAPRSGQGSRVSRRRKLEVPQRRYRQARARRHSAARCAAERHCARLGRDQPRQQRLRRASGLDLELAEDECGSGPPSDISLEDVDEPTVAGIDDDDSDALAIDLDENSINLSDSILLSEAELGESPAARRARSSAKAELGPGCRSRSCRRRHPALGRPAT